MDCMPEATKFKDKVVPNTMARSKILDFLFSQIVMVMARKKILIFLFSQTEMARYKIWDFLFSQTVMAR